MASPLKISLKRRRSDEPVEYLRIDNAESHHDGPTSKRRDTKSVTQIWRRVTRDRLGATPQEATIPKVLTSQPGDEHKKLPNRSAPRALPSTQEQRAGATGPTTTKTALLPELALLQLTDGTNPPVSIGSFETPSNPPPTPTPTPTPTPRRFQLSEASLKSLKILSKRKRGDEKEIPVFVESDRPMKKTRSIAHGSRSSKTLVAQPADSAPPEEPTSDTIYDVFELLVNDADAGAIDIASEKVGILIISEEDKPAWEAYAEDESIYESESDSEDSNAEDFYANDYPEEEWGGEGESDGETPSDEDELVHGSNRWNEDSNDEGSPEISEDEEDYQETPASVMNLPYRPAAKSSKWDTDSAKLRKAMDTDS
ncbi:hypothetical protein K402DRAFT_85004 [Aulographum hederae CBS 113979]|uniref:Transcription factor Iwr1 domain-containing protein n=1 Tax=Aulographum hederae CBS 113979 TaxID=1176131 RepID=A0A6G1H0B5_9PEZI|nr:hypothetical protein K402DRAFT_85004 [Aulographum hederae CBS 113979]